MQQYHHYNKNTGIQCFPLSAYVECSYIRLFRFDVVAGEDSGVVTYRAVPPLSLLLAHQDHISLSERQITRFRRLIGVQRCEFWKGNEYMNRNK